MTYASENDIINEMKNIELSTSSDVTSDAVSDFLDQADAVINMYIGKRYSTPVTASDSVKVLRKIEIDIVVYRIVKILDLSKSNPVPENNLIQEVTEGTAFKQSMRMLEQIRDNKMDLPGQSETDSSGGLASFHTEPANSSYVPFFKKGVDQW